MSKLHRDYEKSDFFEIFRSEKGVPHSYLLSWIFRAWKKSFLQKTGPKKKNQIIGISSKGTFIESWPCLFHKNRIQQKNQIIGITITGLGF